MIVNSRTWAVSKRRFFVLRDVWLTLIQNSQEIKPETPIMSITVGEIVKKEKNVEKNMGKEKMW
jgi:hypothetical protein